MPPEAEENGAHAQELEVNSMQRKIRERARMLIAAGGRTVSSMGHRVKKRREKVGFLLFGNKINYSEVCILISIS